MIPYFKDVVWEWLLLYIDNRIFVDYIKIF